LRLVERFIDLDPLVMSRSRVDRSTDKLHVSEVIRWVDNRVIHRGQRKPYEDLSPNEKKRMGNYVSVGYAWEDLLAQSLAPVFGGEYVRTGEIELDGIVGTPDGLELNGMAVDETKATWRSSRRDISTDFWSWMVQVKAYCHMLQLNRVSLRVFFVNGNYADSGPQVKQFDLIFEPRELQDNWTMICRNAEAMEKEKRSGSVKEK
jgi:hypothetical protein